ncbi:protein SCO1/2 [Paracoccus solventivorans]|uniref:Protein SCO1/2 n=1 Tax=Paracoccus solventivorans TaxID=53463 RepID=A0A1M7JW92_9RHOB|nr:SCO family protein [Paracoccus solventivorans]SHM57289.1 protein SCO1/2 [Paracoccus solventivorans]
MKLTFAQKMLWAAAALALIAFAALAWTGGLRASGTGEATQEAFRPEFRLEDAATRPVTSEDFRGRYQLVFFGFTNCPDVCPTTLSEVAQVMDGLGSEADRVQPLFISVDPERDAGAELAEFTSAFHPSILGLAGSPEATQAAAESFKVFFAREDDAAAPDGYSMAHASALYLIGPDGDWLRQYAYGMPAADILADLQNRL